MCSGSLNRKMRTWQYIEKTIVHWSPVAPCSLYPGCMLRWGVEVLMCTGVPGVVICKAHFLYDFDTYTTCATVVKRWPFFSHTFSLSSEECTFTCNLQQKSRKIYNFKARSFIQIMQRMNGCVKYIVILHERLLEFLFDSIQVPIFHLQQSYCTLEVLDFFQDVTWHLTLDFPLIWP